MVGIMKALLSWVHGERKAGSSLLPALSPLNKPCLLHHISPGFLKEACDNLELKLRQHFKQAINDMVRIFSSRRLIVK